MVFRGINDLSLSPVCAFVSGQPHRGPRETPTCRDKARAVNSQTLPSARYIFCLPSKMHGELQVLKLAGFLEWFAVCSFQLSE